MMSLIQKPILIPADTTLKRAAAGLRAAEADLALERCSASGPLRLAHLAVADALDVLAKDCLSTSQLPACEEARNMWKDGALPRIEVAKVGCLVSCPPKPRLA